MVRVLFETILYPNDKERRTVITGTYDDEKEKHFVYTAGTWGRSGFDRPNYREFVKAYAEEVLNRTLDSDFYTYGVTVDTLPDEVINEKLRRYVY